jgi:hypothetical protein
MYSSGLPFLALPHAFAPTEGRWDKYAAIMQAVFLSPEQYTMQAACGDGKGVYRTSREDLNLCIGNRVGNLVAQEQ